MRPRRPAPGGRHRRHPACAFRRDRHDARRQRRVIGLYGPDAMGRWPGHRVPRVLWSRTLLRRSVNCETASKVAARRGDRLPGTHAAGPEAPSSGDIRFACAGRAGRASAPASRVGSARRACAACARVICGAPSALARVCMRSSVTSCARVAYRVRRAAGRRCGRRRVACCAESRPVASWQMTGSNSDCSARSARSLSNAATAQGSTPDRDSSALARPRSSGTRAAAITVACRSDGNRPSAGWNGCRAAISRSLQTHLICLA